MNLTNQELIAELNKRVENGTIKTKAIADEVEENSTSLLASLGGKELLLLIGLTATAALFFCYAIKITSSQVASCKVEFDCNPPLTFNSPVSENK